MENVFTWKWLRAALVRALKTVAQTAAATIGTAVMISEVDWRMVVSAALLAGARFPNDPAGSVRRHG